MYQGFIGALTCYVEDIAGFLLKNKGMTVYRSGQKWPQDYNFTLYVQIRDALAMYYLHKIFICYECTIICDCYLKLIHKLQVVSKWILTGVCIYIFNRKVECYITNVTLKVFQQESFFSILNISLSENKAFFPKSLYSVKRERERKRGRQLFRFFPQSLHVICLPQESSQ